MADKVTIKNGGYELTIALLGAEMKSLKNAQGKEVLWQNLKNEEGNDIWKNTAPTLFPMTGPSRIFGVDEDGKPVERSGKYRLDSKEYDIKQHGFARDLVAEVVEQDEDYVKLLLKSSEQTKARYDFDWELSIEYGLNHKGRVQKMVTVTNTGIKDMPFNIGDHEGFAIDGNLADYYLRFDCIEENTKALDGRELITTQGERSIINFSEDMFKKTDDPEKDKAVFFAGLNSKHATIVKRGQEGEKDKGVVTLTLDSPNFLLWSPRPYKFVCPEPWHGEPLASKETEDAKFYNTLAPGESYVLDRIVFAHKERGTPINKPAAPAK